MSWDLLWFGLEEALSLAEGKGLLRGGAIGLRFVDPLERGGRS